MSLINCPECGKEISDKALSCPNCGYVLSKMNDSVNDDKWNSDEMKSKSQKNTKFALLLVLAIVLIGFVGMIVYRKISEANRPLKPAECIGMTKEEIVDLLDNKIKVNDWKGDDHMNLNDNDVHIITVSTRREGNEGILDYYGFSSDVTQIHFYFSDDVLKMIGMTGADSDDYPGCKSFEAWCSALGVSGVSSKHIDGLSPQTCGHINLQGDIDLLVEYFDPGDYMTEYRAYVTTKSFGDKYFLFGVSDFY